MKETNYFSHDYNARSDRKLIKLQTKMGMEGMGIYWCIVEMLYEEAGYLKKDYDSIAFELRTEYARIKSVIEDYELFKTDDEKIWSESCLERLKKRMSISEKARENINKRWEKYNGNTGVLRANQFGNTIKERKGKEIKEKENKEITNMPDCFKNFKNYNHMAKYPSDFMNEEFAELWDDWCEYWYMLEKNKGKEYGWMEQRSQIHFFHNFTGGNLKRLKDYILFAQQKGWASVTSDIDELKYTTTQIKNCR